MQHALIIDDNMVISSEIENRLASMGYTSFDHVWTEEQAVAAARRKFPDLVIVGDEVETGSALNAARRIARRRDVPVLLVTGNADRARARLRAADAFSGPFALNDLHSAVAEATQA